MFKLFANLQQNSAAFCHYIDFHANVHLRASSVLLNLYPNYCFRWRSHVAQGKIADNAPDTSRVVIDLRPTSRTDVPLPVRCGELNIAIRVQPTVQFVGFFSFFSLPTGKRFPVFFGRKFRIYNNHLKIYVSTHRMNTEIVNRWRSISVSRIFNYLKGCKLKEFDIYAWFILLMTQLISLKEIP